MKFLFLAFTVFIHSSYTSLLWSKDNWTIQKGTVDFSHLNLWAQFPAVSRVSCLLRCHTAFARGCGYHSGEKRCHVYLDCEQPSEWAQIDGMDYYVPKIDGWTDLRRYGISSKMMIVTQQLSWMDASSYCEDLGGHLYIMDTAAKRKALMDEFGCKGVTLDEHYWLGFNDKSVEGQWVWADGGAVEHFWNKNQPDSRNGNEDCGLLKGDATFKLNDYLCPNDLKFICETSLTS